MNTLKFNTYTDESGQDTMGKMFIVCTAIIESDKLNLIEDKIIEIERKSGKSKKWFLTGNKSRFEYIHLLLESKILNSFTIYYSIFHNKLDYINLIGSHIAKTILDYCDKKEYISKIFIDKTDKGTLLKLKNEIKSYKVLYKKIRGLTEESNTFVRLADAVCGMVRDLDNKNIPITYKKFFARMKKV